MIRRAILVALLCAGAVSAQTLHGLGFSSKTCVDLDGDGYGTGPVASLITTSSTSVSAAGTATVTLGSVTGLVVGQRVRYDLSSNLEFVTVAAISGSTITAKFLTPHATGASVSAGTTGSTIDFPGYVTDDPGCLGLDADDRDATIHTASQAITKYGSLTAFLAKLGRDIQLYEADTAAGAPDAMAIAALLRSPNDTYYLAPASPTAACLADGTPAQCTGAAYPTNNCTTINTPCLTVSNLVNAGYHNSGAGGDLMIIRDGWNNRLTFYSGASSDFNGAISYPGEHAIIDANAVDGAQVITQQSNCSSPDGANYIFLDGFRLQNNAGIGGGTVDTVACSTQTTSDDHDIWIQHMEGTEGGPQGLATISGFDGINNWVIEYNALHDDTCATSCNTPHGIYIGSHSLASSNTTVRRNLIYRNSWNGLHWNGAGTGMYFDQNVIYDSGVTGLEADQGLSNSFIRGNVMFNNLKEVVFNDYDPNSPGSGNSFCSTQSGYTAAEQGPFTLCPQDQTGNLIENNTFFSTGNANVPNAGSSPDAGCPTGIYSCAKNALEVQSQASPNTQNMGGNTYRNNIFVDYGNNNGTAVVAYGDVIGSCDSICQVWAARDTYDHNLFFQSDGKGGTNVINLGASNYTLSTAGTVTASFTANALGDPKFVADVITNWNNESYFDMRLLPNSPALHSGSTTGVPNYDAKGRAYTEITPSLGALERNLYAQGWTSLTGAGISAAVAPPNGAPLDTLNGAISPSAISLTATNAANYFVGNIIVIDSEAMCINGVSGTTITIGVNSECSGTTSANGRGWAGTTGAAHSNGATVYLNTLTNGGLQGTDASTVYPFQTQYAQAYTQGVGSDGVGRDIPGQIKEMCVGGGGHSNYIGNELYCIRPNLTTPAITRVSGPSVYAVPGYDSVGTWGFPAANSPIGATGADAQLKDGTWNTAHIDANFAYNAWEDKFAKFGGSYAGGNGPHSYDTFEFNFSTNLWERYSGSTHDVDCTNHGTGYSSCAFMAGEQVDPVGTFNGGGFSGLATADPLTQTDWELWQSTGNNSVLTQYYPSLHQHVLRASSQPTLVCCGTTTQGSDRVLISDLRWIFLQGLNGATLSTYKIDISGVTSQTPTASPNPSLSAVTTDASCNGLLQTPGPGLVYIPAISKVLGFPANTGGNTYYLMNPTTWTCTPITIPGGPPTSPFDPYVDGMMQYFPSLDVILLLDDTGANVPRVLSLDAPDPGGSSANPSISCPSATTGAVGTAYSSSFTASGGTSPYTYSMLSGSLPTGLSLNGSTGLVSGTPLTASAFAFTAEVADSINNTGIASCSITISPGAVLATRVSGNARVGGAVIIR